MHKQPLSRGLQLCHSDSLLAIQEAPAAPPVLTNWGASQKYPASLPFIANLPDIFHLCEQDPQFDRVHHTFNPQNHSTLQLYNYLRPLLHLSPLEYDRSAFQ
jgi:hypothetical protein